MERIERLVRIIDDEEKKASSDMASCRKVYDEHVKLLNDLSDYELEYKKKFLHTSQQGIAIEQLQNYNNFMARLEMTKKQQALNVESASASLEKAMDAWQLKRQERSSLEKLNDRLDEKSENIMSKREQNEQDEISSVQFQRNCIDR